MFNNPRQSVALGQRQEVGRQRRHVLQREGPPVGARLIAFYGKMSSRKSSSLSPRYHQPSPAHAVHQRRPPSRCSPSPAPTSNVVHMVADGQEQLPPGLDRLEGRAPSRGRPCRPEGTAPRSPTVVVIQSTIPPEVGYAHREFLGRQARVVPTVPSCVDAGTVVHLAVAGRQ